MKKTFIIGLIFLMLVAQSSLFISVQAEASWLDGWSKRELFYYSASQSVTNYQGSITILNQTGFNSGNTFYIYNETLANFEDLRVTQSDGTTLLSIWNQTTHSGLNCTFWTRFPVVNASYFLYWNNPSANSAWNQTAVFVDVIGDVLGAWPMNEALASDSVKDYSGQGNNGVANGTTMTTSKFAGLNARSFNGTSDYITVSNNANLNPTSKMTIAFWVYLDETAGHQLLNKWDANSGTQSFMIRMNNAVLQGYIYENDHNQVSGSTFNSLSNNVWQFVTVEANGTALMASLNNTVYSTTYAYDGTLNNDSTADLLIGKRATTYLKGDLSNLIICNNSLTSTQRTDLYNNYGDVTLQAGKVLVRNYVYPAPSVSLFGSVESAPAGSEDLTVDDAAGLAVAGFFLALIISIALLLLVRRR